MANPKARMEAITSRPLLLSGIARQTSHAGQQFNLKTVWQYVCEHIEIAMTGFSWSGPPIVPKKLSYGVA